MTGTVGGDFSRTVVDPINDRDFWTIQEYAETNVGPVTRNGSGHWGLWWANLQLGPPNDLFSNATVISGLYGSLTNSNVEATKEPGEPDSFDYILGGASIWLSWTAPATALMTFQASALNYNALTPLVGVYTGSSVSNLTSAQFGEDYGNIVFVEAISNTTYHVQLDGAGLGWGPQVGMGLIVLQWFSETPPIFTLEPQNIDVLEGSNITFTATAIGGTPVDYQWTLTGTNIPGATNSSYSITNVTTNNTGDFTVIASDWDFYSTTSTVAHLQVYPTATPLLSAINITNNQMSFTVSGITNSTYLVQGSQILHLRRTGLMSIQDL